MEDLRRDAPMTRPLDFNVIDLCASRIRRANVMLVLVTEGGAADPAYRIARCLQDYYKRFSLFVGGYCKSAGTLVALGATRSGLTVLSALSTLRVEAYDAFEYFLLETKKRSGGLITTRTAIHVATHLTGSLGACPRTQR